MIAHRYQLEDEIGKGGMGTVYRAVDSHNHQTVAIKQLKTDFATPAFIERFRREGEALRQLNHPNIVKMLDAVEEHGSHYLVMEYVSGGDLLTLLRQEGALPIERTLRIALDMADALTRAHRLDIIHRDLKPANILIAVDGTPRLTDFGIARMGSEPQLTDPDATIGTLDYLPPEALEGQGIDTRADIWAFGVMLFEMISGQHPFRGKLHGETITRILSGQLPDLEILCPDAPINLVDLIYRMLERDREMRVRSVRQVGLELEDVVYGRQIYKQPTTQRFAEPIPDVFSRPKSNLPAQTTPFVGREADIVELIALLDDPHERLISVLAPGGMGKTRLAIEVGCQALSMFKDGVYFVELRPLGNALQIPSAIATATEYPFRNDRRDQRQQILDFLSNKQLLLIMDNYEHLLEGAELTSDILHHAPQVQILVTSRQRLHQSGETVFNLEGMDFPSWETPEDALEYAAVKLFMQGARRVSHGFELTVDNMDTIARICKLVQGMPLGIVLAASWVGMLSTAEIATEITRGIDFLEANMSDMPEHHRSIRAIFDQTWEQMTLDEQDVFMRLSLFRGGFTREAAQVVTGAHLQTLMNLMNKSLIRRDMNDGRYDIHELLRQYALEQLERAGRLVEVEQKYTAYFADLLVKMEPLLKGSRQLYARDVIAADLDNVLVMFERAFDSANEDAVQRALEGFYLFVDLTENRRRVVLVDIAEGKSLSPILRARVEGYCSDDRNVLERAIDVLRDEGSTRDRVFVMIRLGRILSVRDSRHSLEVLEDALGLVRALDDPTLLMVNLFWLCNSATWLGLHTEGILERAKGWVNEAQAIVFMTGNRAYEARLYTNRGDLAAAEVHYRESVNFHRKGYEITLELGNRVDIAWVGWHYAYALYSVYGDAKTAKPILQQSLDILLDLNDTSFFRHWAQTVLANIAYYEGDLETASELCQRVMTEVGGEMFIDNGAALILEHITYIRGEPIRAFARIINRIEDYTINGFKFAPSDVWALVVALDYEKGDYNRAVARLAIGMHHPHFFPALMPIDPILRKLEKDLRQILGEDAFTIAYEQGKSLDLEAVLQEIMDELKIEDANSTSGHL